MAKVKPGHHASPLEDIYVWMHRHFPHIVDCRPIDLEAVLGAGGFELRDRRELEIWSMPVTAAVATRT